MTYDSDFLRRLDEHREKTIYGRIISLTMDENPIEQIEGQITSGSVNVDGTSAVRRTCSLNMVTNDININDYYWGLNTKFKLEIGVENKIDDRFPDVIWFKMGTYIITSFNVSLTTNSYTIALQGKDKMCLLNGEVGGVINATTDFGTYDYTDADGYTVNQKYPIKKIIWDMVHAYANEPFHNIIINDLDELGLELLDYKYDTPMYIFRNPDSDEYSGEALFGDDGNNYVAEEGNEKYDLDSFALENSDEFYFDNLTQSMLGYGHEPTAVYRPSSEGRIKYYVCKIEYGYTAGYRTCDLVYAGDLIANIGETITSVLDKIKGMLGEFEYFYDLDGQFIFQRKKSLVNTVWTPQRRDGDRELYVESLAMASNSMYNFSGTLLISSIQNNPNLLNLRNDYTVWGKRKGVTGQELPIHMRYAIDNKPEIYVDYNGDVWTVFSQEEISKQNEARVVRRTRADIYAAWENFERDINKYPRSTWINPNSNHPTVDKEEKWWSMDEWCEYYKILFLEYPGNLHPQDEMGQYCHSYGANAKFVAEHPGYYIDSYSRPSLDQYPNAVGRGWQVMEIFVFEDPQTHELSYGYSGHSGCVHTYGQWLDAQYFVNGVKDNNGNWIYEPFSDSYPWTMSIDNRNNRVMYVDGLNTPNALKTMRNNLGLIHVGVYCYDPKIPEDRREAQLALIEQEITYIDPYEGHYHCEMDWRELIYRMAIDYRRHNHDDDFEIQLQNRHLPWNIYTNGITGYEQYYTDLEGFWRQLYNPLTTQDEVNSANEYFYQKYINITDKTDLENIYIQGVYKPVAYKVKAVIEENQDPNVTYLQDTSTGKYYPYDPDTWYFISTTNGFSFSAYNKGSEMQDFISLAAAGQLYTRDFPIIQNLYKVNSDHDGIYKVMDLCKYASDTKRHFLKKINSSDPQNPIYEEIDSAHIINSQQKAGSYIIVNEQEYNDALEVIEVANRNYNELDDLAIAALAQFQEEHLITSALLEQYLTAEEFTEKLQGILEENLRESDSVTKSVLKSLFLGLTTYQEQYELLQEVLRAAEAAISEVTIDFNIIKNSVEYQLYSEYLQERLPKVSEATSETISSVVNQMKDYLIYDDDNKYSMDDVWQNSYTRRIYFSLVQNSYKEILKDLINFSLNNDGEKLANFSRKSIYYYGQNSKFYQADDSEVERRFWNKDVFEAPESLIFWFDFLTGDGELRQFTTQAVGDRPKAINDANVKSIYYRDTPKIIFTTREKLASEEKKTGYNYFILPQSGYENMFSISTQGIDAKNRIDELIFQFSYCTESITISAIPVYYLDVNRRISVYDKETGITGEYIVSRITYPLQYNGMMSIMATKAPENSVTEREE